MAAASAKSGCGKVRPYGAKLGCGEQGCTYADKETSVVKVTPFGSKVTQAQWANEAHVGQVLGNLGIAPKIYDYYVCEGKGYIEMERLKDAKRLPDTGVQIRERVGDSVTDHISLMPAHVQQGFVKALVTMIDAGYLHMDNHIENLGYIMEAGGYKPIVFDFGFTVAREMSPADKCWALAFSLFQILEHVPSAELESSVFWPIATSVIRGTATWPPTGASPGMTIAEVGAYVKKFDTIAKLTAAGKKVSKTNYDLVAGTLAYASYFQNDRPKRYSSRFYNMIYSIRKSQFRG